MARFLILILFLASCSEISIGPAPTRLPVSDAPVVSRSSSAATASFRRAVRRIEPVAERLCQRRNPDFGVRGCDYRFGISNDPRLG